MSQSPPDYSHTEIREFLGVYAIHALDPETAAVVGRHLDQCIKCSLEVDQHRQVVGLLANSRVEPPAHVWAGIARRLEGADPPPWRQVAERLSPAANFHGANHGVNHGADDEVGSAGAEQLRALGTAGPSEPRAVNMSAARAARAARAAAGGSGGSGLVAAA